ncbi:13483_t:CDS:1, partial [Funneliformis caledonium]
LTQKQYEDLLCLTSDIKNEIYKEFVKYLTTILEELCIEISQEKNIIDELIHYQSKLGFMKKCNTCQTANIDNKK